MPSRRPHQKSRNGCVQCKARKIKCDERGPVCSNCLKKNFDCQFPGAAFPTAFPASAFRSTFLNNMTKHSETANPSFNVKDLELMHFYCTQTCRTLSDDESLLHLAQEVLPQEAFSHDFLMHSLLVLSSLHFITTHPNKRVQFAEIAITHHNAALMKYTSALNTIRPENCTAIFACSAILVYCAFAFLHVADPIAVKDQSQDPIEETLELFTLLRGVNTVIQTSRDSILAGKLGPLLRNDLITKPSGNPPADVATVLDALDQHYDTYLESAVDDEEARRTNNQALQLLRDCFEIMALTSADKDVVLSWPILIPEAYLSLLRSRDPMALVILAHYGVVLHSLDHHWWAHGRGTQLLYDLNPLVGGAWKDYLQWPKMKTMQASLEMR